VARIEIGLLPECQIELLLDPLTDQKLELQVGERLGEIYRKVWSCHVHGHCMFLFVAYTV
jgi:hypothetical protein